MVVGSHPAGLKLAPALANPCHLLGTDQEEGREVEHPPTSNTYHARLEVGDDGDRGMLVPHTDRPGVDGAEGREDEGVKTKRQ